MTDTLLAVLGLVRIKNWKFCLISNLGRNWPFEWLEVHRIQFLGPRSPATVWVTELELKEMCERHCRLVSAATWVAGFSYCYGFKNGHAPGPEININGRN